MISYCLQLVLNALVRHYVATHVECHIMRRLRLLHGKAILVAIAILSRRQHAGDFLQHKHDNEIVYELAAAFCVGKLQVTSELVC